MTEGARLDIVVVNWNAGVLLADCIRSVAASHNAGHLRVIVVDNASSDGSADALPGEGLDCLVVRNADNRGFGAACNQGAALGRAPAILFLNPDTRLLPETLDLALAKLAASPEIGILGVRQTDEAGRTLRTCARFPTPIGLAGQAIGLDRLAPRLCRPHFMLEWDHETTRTVDQVMGAFLMIRRPLFEAIGGFDPRFFVYFEDVDLCREAARRGAGVLHLAEVRIWHGTQGTTRQIKDRRLFYFLRGKALYVAKHHGRLAALALLALDLVVQMPLRALRAAAARQGSEAAAVRRAALMLIRDLPDLLPRLARPPTR